MADTVYPEVPAPGFYLKFSVCNEYGDEIVKSKPIRILTAREFYEQRLIGANIAQLYAYFARFAGKASEAVTLLDAMTLFSRSNSTPRPARLSYYALSEIATQAVDTLGAVVNALRDTEDAKFIDDVKTAMATEGKTDEP
jgi:hypothetical protein